MARLTVPLLLQMLGLLLSFAPAPVGGRWLLLAYLAADNDLDCYAVRDLLELSRGMEAAGGGDPPLIRAFVDRGGGQCKEEGQRELGNWRSAAREVAILPSGRIQVGLGGATTLPAVGFYQILTSSRGLHS
jgi:hypothetical protein